MHAEKTTSVANLGLDLDIQTFFFKSPTVLGTLQRFINKGAQNKATKSTLQCSVYVTLERSQQFLTSQLGYGFAEGIENSPVS